MGGGHGTLHPLQFQEYMYPNPNPTCELSSLQVYVALVRSERPALLYYVGIIQPCLSLVQLVPRDDAPFPERRATGFSRGIAVTCLCPRACLVSASASAAGRESVLARTNVRDRKPHNFLALRLGTSPSVASCRHVRWTDCGTTFQGSTTMQTTLTTTVPVLLRIQPNTCWHTQMRCGLQSR